MILYTYNIFTMEQQEINQKMLEELKQLRIDINIINDNLANRGEEFTEEEHVSLDQAMDEYGRGEVISHEDLKQ